MLRAIIVLGKYPAIVVTVAYALNYAGWAIPPWVVCIGALATVFLVVGGAITFQCWSVFRAAERHGAVVAPKVKGRWFGNLDVLKDVLHSFRTGYPGKQLARSNRRAAINMFLHVVGDVLREKFIELGPTYRLNVLWDFGVLTCDPAIIKVSTPITQIRV